MHALWAISQEGLIFSRELTGRETIIRSKIFCHFTGISLVCPMCYSLWYGAKNPKPALTGYVIKMDQKHNSRMNLYRKEKSDCEEFPQQEVLDFLSCHVDRYLNSNAHSKVLFLP